MPPVAPALPPDPFLTFLNVLKPGKRRAQPGQKTAAVGVPLAPQERFGAAMRWPQFTVPRQLPQMLAEPGMAAGVPVCLGQRISMPTGQGRQQPPPALREGFSFLLGAPGSEWVVSSPLFNGAYGSVGFAYDRLGERFAVKSVRLPPQSMSDAEAQACRLQPLAKLREEVARTSVIRSIIEDQLCNGRPTSLLARTPWLHHGHGRLEVHDIIVDAPGFEAHVVMTAQQGSALDLWGIKPLLPARDRYLAAKSLAMQGFAELSIMHEQALYGHGDVSLGNVLYDRWGRMRLCDFGFAERLDRPNGQGHKLGWWGTLLAPEMVEAWHTPLGAAADTFALAVAVFEMAGEPSKHHYNPFYLQGQGRSSAQVEDHAHWVVERLRTFKLELAPLDGLIHAKDILRSTQHDLVDFFGPLAEADAPLAELLLNGAMQLDPALRSSSLALLRALQGLDEGEPMDWVAYQKMIEQVVRRDHRHAALRFDAQAFVKAFVRQQAPSHGAEAYGWLPALPYVKQSLSWFMGICQPKIPMARPRATRGLIDAMA